MIRQNDNRQESKDLHPFFLEERLVVVRELAEIGSQLSEEPGLDTPAIEVLSRMRSLYRQRAALLRRLAAIGSPAVSPGI